MDVACLQVPNFAVALARRDNPRLRGRAVVIGGSPEEHARVTACSAEAAAAGVTVGTTLRRALSLCHNAVFLPLKESVIGAEAAKILEVLSRHSPAVEAIAPGHAHFEARGLACLVGLSDEEWLRELYEAVVGVTGLPLGLAGAETVFAAHSAALTIHDSALTPRPPLPIQDSRFAIRDSVREATSHSPQSTTPNCLVVPRGGAKAFLSQLPVEVLPAAPEMHQRLRLFGLLCLGQIAALPFSAMQAQFGHEGAKAWRLARGEDDSIVVPGREEVRVVEEVELPAPAATVEPLVAGTQGLLQRALARVEVRGQSLRRLDWRLGLESGEAVTRRFVFREPTSDPARMLFVVKGRVERLELPSPVVSIAVTLSGLCSEYGHQSNLWQIGPRRWQELVEAVEQLNARVEGPQVYHVVEVQPWSRIPERQLGLVAFGR
jgi:nucleotidyltransferase/DNA polymerase involved in DNA repair